MKGSFYFNSAHVWIRLGCGLYMEVRGKARKFIFPSLPTLLEAGSDELDNGCVELLGP